MQAPPEADAQTILLIGSDHRPKAQGQKGAALGHGDPRRASTRSGTGSRLLSIPRDLYVEIPGHGHDRINMAFEWGGAKLLTRTVRETFGVKIDHFVEVDFRGFRSLVQDVGGVWIPVDQRYFNKNVGTFETNYSDIDLQPGYQKLNGEQALAFARYRHDDSDIYRAARQQLVIREALRQSLAHKLDLLRLRRLARHFAEATTSDIDSIDELWSLARAVRSARIERLTIDGTDSDALRRLLPHRGRDAAARRRPPAARRPSPRAHARGG